MIKSLAHMVGLGALFALLLVVAYQLGGHAHGGNALGTAYASPPPVTVADAAAPVVADAGVIAADAGTAVGSASGAGTGSAVAPIPAVTAPDPATISPTQEAEGLVGFLTTGKWLPAIGGVLMLLVWALRSGLAAKWKFWSSRAGGYLLGFGVPLVVYLAAALKAGAPLSLSLLLHALGAIGIAAGGWEHIGDLLTKLKPAPAVS